MQTVRRLVRVVAIAILTTLVVVPVTARAQQRVYYHDLGHHDPIPLRVRLSWTSWTPTAKTARLQAEPRDLAQRVSHVPVTTVCPALSHSWQQTPIDDEHLPIVAVDRSLLPFRGPPAHFN
jgi:hypothetical protein